MGRTLEEIDMKPAPYRRYIVSLLLALIVCTLFPAKITTSGPVISLTNAQVPGSVAEVSLDTWIRGMIALYQNVPGLQGLTNAVTTKTCVGFWNNATSPRCWVRQIFAVTGAFFMWLGIKLVVLAGASFEYVLKYGVVEFGQTLKSLMGGIEVGWEAMRDIANIVIIGMFIFIAINIILGVKDFGDKKKIARVLIVAVLINFSLLFTKAIVDASNFVAFQFYKSMVQDYDPRGTGTSVAGATTLQVTPGTADAEGGVGATSAGVDSGSVAGIAGRFLRMMRIEGFADSYNAIRKNQEEGDDLGALGYGVLMLVFLLLTAFVFFYGTYLLITRAILIVFLLLVSAVAFASWLIPHHFIEEGWLKWWKALLKSAFLAPILMAFLWATYNISTALSENPLFKGGSLGDLATNASKPENTAALFSFFLVLGLLYASFKASSDLAGSISGFGAVGTAVRNAAFGIPALAWRFGAAPLARQTIGRAAYFKRDELVGEGKQLRRDAGYLRETADLKFGKGHMTEKERFAEYQKASTLEAEAGRKALWAGRAKTIAGAGFNIGDANLTKQLAKASGVSELIAGQRQKDAGGFAHGVEAKIKLGEERAKAIELSPAERQKVTDDARAKVFENRNVGAEELDRKHAAAKAEHDGEKAKMDDEHSSVSLATRLKGEAEKERKAFEQSRREGMLALQERLAAAGGTDPAIESEIARHQGVTNTEMKLHDSRVAVATDKHEKEMEPFNEAVKRLKEAADNLKDYNTETARLAQEGGRDEVRYRRRGAVGAAEYVGRKSAGYFYRGTGVGQHIGGEVSKKLRGRVGREGRLSELLRRLPDDSATGDVDE